MLLILTLIILNNFQEAFLQSLQNTVHKTQAAAEKINDLKCYSCHTMEQGEMCSDLTLAANFTIMKRKCKADEFICMVKRFSYTLSTENSTSSPKMWAMERKCASNCETGCIVIGERTKLYACTSCCEESFCNDGKASARRNSFQIIYHLIFFILFTVLGKFSIF